MTNREKFGEKVLDILSRGSNPAMSNGKLVKCSEINCSECGFLEVEYCTCTIQRAAWLNAEYKDPEVDWSKVAVDTKILVRDFDGERWIKQYYSGRYDKDRGVGTWFGGSTSWSVNVNDPITFWLQAMLAEDEE